MHEGLSFYYHGNLLVVYLKVRYRKCAKTSKVVQSDFLAPKEDFLLLKVASIVLID